MSGRSPEVRSEAELSSGTAGKKFRRVINMEKDTERNMNVLQGDGKIGEVQIADDVVAMIAGLAALEVDGVASMAGNATNELLSMVGVKGGAKGARVEVVDRVVSVDMVLHLKYGYNIPTVSGKIQEKVKSAIETMTGLAVAEVNIRIAGVVMNS